MHTRLVTDSAKQNRLIALWMLALIGGASGAAADDWPQWGGPQRDLIWREQGIVQTLPSIDQEIGMLPRMWSADIGAGYAGPAVADGRVYLCDRPEERSEERVLCFDAVSGKLIWEHKYEAHYTISYPLGPRATPTVDGDRVYVLGAVGNLICLDSKNGNVLWKKFLPDDCGTVVPPWGMAGAPLVDGDQLIVLAGAKPNGLVVSLDKLTGQELWRSLEGDDAGYCAPVILTIGGRRQVVVWHPAAVCGLDPKDGSLLWEVPSFVGAGMTIATPRQLGNRLFVSSFFSGPLMIDLGDSGTSPNVLWQAGSASNEVRNNTLHAVMCTPVLNDGHVYGVGSYGELRCLDADSGNIVWETREATGRGRWWNAFIIPHEDRVVICNEQGEIIFAKFDRDGYHESSRALLIEPTQPVGRRMTVWSHPAFAMRSVFARNDKQLIRVNLAAE